MNGSSTICSANPLSSIKSYPIVKQTVYNASLHCNGTATGYTATSVNKCIYNHGYQQSGPSWDKVVIDSSNQI